MGFADGFAVPAGAFRVDGRVQSLVGLGGPFESGGELDFINFVVMVDEFLGFGGSRRSSVLGRLGECACGGLLATCPVMCRGMEYV